VHISVLFLQTVRCVAETCSCCVQCSVWTGSAVLYWGRSGKQLFNNCAVWLLKLLYHSIEEGNFVSNYHNRSRNNFRYDVRVVQIWLCVWSHLYGWSRCFLARLSILSPPPRAICHTRSVLLTILIFVTNRMACLLWHTPWDSPVLQTDPASVVIRHGGSCDDISVSATTVTSLFAAAIIDLCNVRTVCLPLTCCSPAKRRCNHV
jgi:hypothetical protein